MNITHGWPTDGIGNRAKNPNSNTLEGRDRTEEEEDEKGNGCFLTTAAATMFQANRPIALQVLPLFRIDSSPSPPVNEQAMRAERQKENIVIRHFRWQGVHTHLHPPMTGYTDDGGWDGSTVQFGAALLTNYASYILRF